MLLFLERKGFSEETYWTFSYSPLLDDAGKVGGLFCACHEATRKVTGVLICGISGYLEFDDDYHNFLHLLAAQIASAKADVDSFEAEHRRMQALEEITEATNTFFSNVSHEFRTPLTLLLNPIKDILFQSSKKQILEVNRTQLEIYGIVSQIEPAVELYGDSQVIHNLLDNAIKYSPENKIIQVNLNRKGDEALLMIKGQGIGMTEHETEKIFNKFYRATPVGKNKGMGLDCLW